MRGPNILKRYLYYYHCYYCNYDYYSIIIIAAATDNSDAPKKYSNPAPLFPSFNAVQGTTYFKDALKRINRMKVFTIPSWMPRLREPNSPFNFSPPS